MNFDYLQFDRDEQRRGKDISLHNVQIMQICTDSHFYIQLKITSALGISLKIIPYNFNNVTCYLVSGMNHDLMTFMTVKDYQLTFAITPFIAAQYECSDGENIIGSCPTSL